jgi:hypothetical protein
MEEKMDFTNVIIGNIVHVINRPPNNQEDLVEGVVLEKKESSSSQIVIVGVSNPTMGYIKTYDIPTEDVFDSRMDAIAALEVIYNTDAATKAAYIAALRA